MAISKVQPGRRNSQEAAQMVPINPFRNNEHDFNKDNFPLSETWQTDQTSDRDEAIGTGRQNDSVPREARAKFSVLAPDKISK
ncbi:unnamed protein product [Sphenostylis stenocarpa]|uniref:Uncharacterized protein n=1 Tax=Sphenostylis stenocarpa TaxID=92480 RepID=A0AA86RPH7_9FABA|nr:unnamed protein product [Sphenostylis stenocarpa]